MGFWSFVKKDLGYFKTVARTEKRFHKAFWKMIAPGSLAGGSLAGRSLAGGMDERQPWETMDKALRETRMKQERFVLVAMIFLWMLLTAYLVGSRNWEGFAVWLLFAALVVRSVAVIRELNKGLHPGKGLHHGRAAPGRGK